MKLTRSEYFKLEWIRDHPGIGVQHVRGKVLDSLINKGLVDTSQSGKTVKLSALGAREFDDDGGGDVPAAVAADEPGGKAHGV